MNQRKIERQLAAGDKDTVINGIMAMVFKGADVPWVSAQLLRLAAHENLEVAALALTCFGHLARLHRNVGDVERVAALLRARAAENSPLAGAAADALDDMEIFMGFKANASGDKHTG